LWPLCTAPRQAFAPALTEGAKARQLFGGFSGTTKIVPFPKPARIEESRRRGQDALATAGKMPALPVDCFFSFHCKVVPFPFAPERIRIAAVNRCATQNPGESRLKLFFVTPKLE